LPALNNVTVGYVIWLVLSNTDRWFTAVCRQRPTRKPCCSGETARRRIIRLYRNLQRHHSVLPAIARLSCWRGRPTGRRASNMMNGDMRSSPPPGPQNNQQGVLNTKRKQRKFKTQW